MRILSFAAAAILTGSLQFSMDAGVRAQQAPPAFTQGTGQVKRTQLHRAEVPGTNFDTAIDLVEIAGDVVVPRHTHFGVESSSLIEGDILLAVAGQPDRAMKAGDIYQIPAGVPHGGKSGPGGAKIIASYVVERGKPFATPAP